MPPAMHPKSFSTAGLFTSTAVLSFLVVAAPHILPCPAAGSEHAESASTPTTPPQKKKRRCPMPRPAPGGLVGEVLGKKEGGTATKEVEAFWGKKVISEKRSGESR